MLHFRPRHTGSGLLPVLCEALIAEPLWGIVYQFTHPDDGQPYCDYIETTVLNDDDEERTVVPLWTCQAYAEQYLLGWDSPYRERMMCVQSVYGGSVLKRLVQRHATIVIDHGHDGLILRPDAWMPALALHGKTTGIDLLPPDTSIEGWRTADPDKFPVWRDRLTSLLHNVESIRHAWLLWLPATADAPRRLCLATMSAVSGPEARIHAALPLMANGLGMPPLAYLPLNAGHALWRTLPDQMFYGHELEHALNIASGKPSSGLYRL